MCQGATAFNMVVLSYVQSNFTYLKERNTVPCIPAGPKSCLVRNTAWSWYSKWSGSERCWEWAQRHTCSRLRDGFPCSIRLIDWRRPEKKELRPGILNGTLPNLKWGFRKHTLESCAWITKDCTYVQAFSGHNSKKKKKMLLGVPLLSFKSF